MTIEPKNIINIFALMESLHDILNQKDILLEELISQISKDLYLSGIDSDNFDNLKTAGELVAQLNVFVSDMITYQPELFNRFMYRIDVDEQTLNHLIYTRLDDLVNHISQLILKREMQKIIFRKQFGA